MTESEEDRKVDEAATTAVALLMAGCFAFAFALMLGGAILQFGGNVCEASGDGLLVWVPLTTWLMNGLIREAKKAAEKAAEAKKAE